MNYLCGSEAALSARNHFVPLVVEHVHEAVRLVLTNQLRDVGCEGGVLLEPDAISCGGTAFIAYEGDTRPKLDTKVRGTIVIRLIANVDISQFV